MLRAALCAGLGAVALALALIVVAPAVAGQRGSSGEKVTLTAFVGSASKPPALAAKAAFEKKYPNIIVDMTFGGSGTLLNQMKLEEMGDIYMPGSDDYMDKAESQKVVVPASRRIVAYLVPTICVQHGNPKKIRGLQDLARPGITVGLARAGAVCLGDVSDEILRKAGVEQQVKANVINYAASCELTQQMIQLGEVDAIIGWDSFKAWAPDKIDLVPIPANLVRVRSVPAAVAVYSKHEREARLFVSFLTSKQGKEIFSSHGYSVEPPKVK
jgi:molybdate transport system substrate-binding protein